MENKTLKKQLLALCGEIELGLINPDQYRAYDLDLIVKPDIKADELVDWFRQFVESREGRRAALFVMSLDTLVIVRTLCGDASNYVWAFRAGAPNLIMGRPYIIKAKLEDKP